MKPKYIVIGLAVIAASVSTVWAGVWPGPRPTTLESSLRSSTSILFRVSRTETKEFTISSPAQVASLTSGIRLNLKPPCMCIHHELAVFSGPSGNIKVSFCDHCFDVNRVSYAMPREFYAHYKQLVPKNW